MSYSLDSREEKIEFIYETMTGFYSVMRNLQEDYKTYSQNYSKEALELLSKSTDFINAVEAVRTLDSIRSIDDEGIDELTELSRTISLLYHLRVQTKIENKNHQKGTWETIWDILKGPGDSPIVKKSLETITDAIADVGNKIGDGLKSGVDWVIEHEPDSPIYQRLCNPLFKFFKAGGAIQSLIQNGNITDTQKKSRRELKSLPKRTL